MKYDDIEKAASLKKAHVEAMGRLKMVSDWVGDGRPIYLTIDSFHILISRDDAFQRIKNVIDGIVHDELDEINTRLRGLGIEMTGGTDEAR